METPSDDLPVSHRIDRESLPVASQRQYEQSVEAESYASKAKSATRCVWKHVGPLIIVGLIVGALLIVLGQYLHTPSTAEHPARKELLSILLELPRELGIGLFVAVFAVFGYEFANHISGLANSQADLKRQIIVLERASNEITGINDPYKGIEIKLNDLLGNDQIVSNLMNFIKSAHAIDHKSSKGREYLAVLSDILREHVVDNAAGISKLFRCIQEANCKEGLFQFNSPDSRKTAGRMLHCQLNILEDGDKYDSVANVMFYDEGRMSEFINSIEEACKRGVNIRRIFNVTNFEEDRRISSGDKFEQAVKIVKHHLYIAKLIEKNKYAGSYMIRFFGMLHMASIHTIYSEADFPHLAKLPNSYFGIFNSALSEPVLLYVAEDIKRVSKMSMCLRPSDDPTARVFEEMWGNSEDSSNNPICGNKFNKNWP